MSSLKKKIFILVVSLLSFFLLFLLIFFNVSIYNKETKDVKAMFAIFNQIQDRLVIDNNTENNTFLFNNEIYIVKYNRYGNVEKILTNTSNNMSEDNIMSLINKNANKINKKKNGSLYTSDYLFNMTSNNYLIIINNENTKDYLTKMFFLSILILLILESIIIYSSIKIVKWIVEPVSDAFDKQKQFIYDASHELKTPIAIIQASAETLEKDPKEEKWLDNIKSETERMNKLVANLLELSKTENIKEQVEYTDVNLSKLIEKKSLSFESLMFENNLKLINDIEDNINFKCDQERIKELLSILIDNAIKHSLDESKIEVKLKQDKLKNNIMLSVTNRGDEIPINEREKIFERFYRIDKSRNRDENRYGLGLSIAKNIVLNHDGSIKVDCKDGYTTFIVNFKQN